MYYIYILQSINDPNQTYVGITKNLKKRFYNHNSGTTPHTSKYKPWKLIIYLAFSNKEKAVEFEKYLKSHSGRAFSKKRFL